MLGVALADVHLLVSSLLVVAEQISETEIQVQNHAEEIMAHDAAAAVVVVVVVVVVVAAAAAEFLVVNWEYATWPRDVVEGWDDSKET